MVSNMIKLFKPKKNSKSLFLISYILILLLILMIGVVLYYATYQQVASGIHQQNRQALAAAVAEVDDTLTLMKAVARQIASNLQFNQLAKMTSTDPLFYYQAYTVQSTLKSMTPMELLMPTANAYLYMGHSNYMISSSRFLDFDFYVHHQSAYGVEAETLRLIMSDQSCWEKLISLQEEQMDSSAYLYICPLSAFDVPDYGSRVLMCYEINTEDLDQIFSTLNRYDSGYLAVFDQAGSLMLYLSTRDSLSAPDHMLFNSLSFEDSIARMTDSESGEQMLVTQNLSSYNGWQYYLVQPEEDAYYSIASYQHLFLLITIAALAAGSIIAVAALISGNRHVARLTNKLSESEDKNTSLNQLVEKQKPMVIESYMRRIMEGSITTNDEMQYIIQELSLDRPGTKFHVLYTEVSPPDGQDIHTNDLELRIQNYDILVREALRRYFPDTGYIYKPSDRTFAILIASDQAVPFEQVVKQNREVFIALHHELLENYGIWIRGGLGARNGLVSYTWKSYQQAKDAKSITTAEKYILSTVDFAHSSDVYYFPESLAVQLSGFISTGNKEQVIELFKLIRNENTVKRSLSYAQQSWLISDVRSTLFKKRHALATDDLDAERLKILDLVDRQFEGEMSLSNLKTIALELCSVCRDSADGNELILKIQEYITSNYHDPDLGLTKISDEFGISENYFSYLFKKEVSENFSTYLERLRMAKAKELILDSNIALSTLYQHLGYNNAASFRRAFKKNFGVSPKEMRDKINAK